MPRRFLFLTAAAIAAFSLVACGGDDDDDSGSDSDSERTEAASTRNSADGTQTSGDAKSTPKPGDGTLTGSGADDLKKVVKDLTGKTFQANYDIKISSAGEETKGVVTLAQKPPKQVTKFALDGGVVLQIISDGTTDITCSSFGANDGSCTKSDTDPLTSAAFDFEQTLTELSQNVDVKNAADQKIAGRDGRCFTINQDGQDSLACFDKKDGYILKIETKTVEGDYTLTATEVKSNVDDKLFVAPYAVN